MEKYNKKDVVLTGFALFAMLFGAGNLIFPPMLGYESGSKWTVVAVSFIITAVGLPLLGIISSSFSTEGMAGFTNRVSPLFSKIYGVALILAIGPLLALPRTGATAFEITFYGTNNEGGYIKYIYLLTYFVLTFLFSIKPSKVIDRIGAILTPVLLVVLAIIIYLGLTRDVVLTEKILDVNPFKKGFVEGYQTMDTLASVVFAGVILKSIKSGRKLTKNQEFSFLVKSSLIATIGLAIVYSSLVYIGASFDTVFVDLTSANKIELLVKMSNYLLGRSGFILLAICVAGACLTTAIGLTATVGEYFSGLLGISYGKIVLVTVLSGFIFSIKGVENIVKISVPILVFLYPITIALIFLNLLGKKIKNDNIFKVSILLTGIVALYDTLSAMGIAMDFIKPMYNLLPFAEYGLAWVVPAIIGAIIGYFIKSDK